MRLLEIYAKEGNVQKALLAAVKLTVYHERWYHEIVVSEVAGRVVGFGGHVSHTPMHHNSILPRLLATLTS